MLKGFDHCTFYGLTDKITSDYSQTLNMMQQNCVANNVCKIPFPRSLQQLESYIGAFLPEKELKSPTVHYEEARQRETDERDAVQKKTFTKWMNKHLLRWPPFPSDYMQHWSFTKAGLHILDLFEDLRDGHNLISLLEVLAHDILPRERGHMRFHKIQNVQIALDFLRLKGIRLVNIRSDEIVDGNPKLTLGLVWTIILHFQVSDVVVPGQEDISARDALLVWSRRITGGYPGVKITDFSTSWSDGKAFLSIIHRNRPDLINFHQTFEKSNKENLETAFSLAEKEFGVTRLLDTEDVDVPNPDEKSIMTYVSSLYDVFPQVHSAEICFMDNQRNLKLEEYMQVTSDLISWLKDSMMSVVKRSSSQSVNDMKSQLKDLHHFKVVEIPSRQKQKQCLTRLHDEIRLLIIPGDNVQLGIAEELTPHGLEQLWNHLMAALLEQEAALQSEMSRLDGLTRLADKLSGEIRHADDRLADLHQCIESCVLSADFQSFETGHNYPTLERSLMCFEEDVKGIFREVQVLHDSGVPQSQQLLSRISDLQSRQSLVSNRLYGCVAQALLQKPSVDGGRCLSQHGKTFTSVFLGAANPALRHLQDCLDWINAQQRLLDRFKYSSDQQGVSDQLLDHSRLCQEILSFQSRIDQCYSDASALSSSDHQIYACRLSGIEADYSLLTNTSKKILKCLEKLNEFLLAVTKELAWLRNVEKRVLMLEWSNQTPNLFEIKEHQKSLMHQLELRQRQFNLVQEDGRAMVLERHPASSVLEAYLGDLQSSWSWLLQLADCLDEHVKQITAHRQFFKDARHCEDWMSRQVDVLHSRFADVRTPTSQVETLIRELQGIHHRLSDYGQRVNVLCTSTSHLFQLSKRVGKVDQPVRVYTLCSFQHQTTNLAKGEECFLVDNCNPQNWKVRTSMGDEISVPSICLSVTLPDQDAIDCADRLKHQYDHLVKLWHDCNRCANWKSLCSTIDQIQKWDLEKCLSLGRDQRDHVWKTLKDEAEKFMVANVQDSYSSDLQVKLVECRHAFDRLSTEAVDKEGRTPSSAAQVLLQELDSSNQQLTTCEEQLTCLYSQSLPCYKQCIDDVFRKHNELLQQISTQEDQLDRLKGRSASLSPCSRKVEAKLNMALHKCHQLRVVSQMYVKRLKCCELVITETDDFSQLANDYEKKLASSSGMSSEVSVLFSMQEDLISMQTSMKKQNICDQLLENLSHLESLVERGHPTVARYDLESIKNDSASLISRWNEIKLQISERLTSFTSSTELLSLYRVGLATETDWLTTMQHQVSLQPELTGDENDARLQLQPIMAIYNQLTERKYQIETVNRDGGRYIREAKIYDKRLKNYCQSVMGHDGDGDVEVCFGSGNVSSELNVLNQQYMELVTWTMERLKIVKYVLAKVGIDVQAGVAEERPLLRTFREELVNLSSMLLCEDVAEFLADQHELESCVDKLEVLSAKTNHSNDDTGSDIDPLTGDNLLAGQTSKKSPVAPCVGPFPQILESCVFSEQSTPLTSIGSFFTLANVGNDVSQIPVHNVITASLVSIAPRGQLFSMAGILNSNANMKMNLVEALRSGLIDPQTHSLYDTQSQVKLSLPQASKAGLLDEEMCRILTQPCGLMDSMSNQELSLIEAIQQEMYDPYTNTFRDDGKSDVRISVMDALSNGLILESCSSVLVGQSIPLTSVTVTRRKQPTDFCSLSLFQAMEKRVYNNKLGKVSDPVTGSSFSLRHAIDKGIISPTYREVLDQNSGAFLTLTEAAADGIIDLERGLYIQKRTKECFSLEHAVKYGFIRKLTSLVELVQCGRISECGQVFDELMGQMITFKEALCAGIIDTDARCILFPSTGKFLGILEAIKSGLMTDDGSIVDSVTGQSISMLKALAEGKVKFVKEDVLFCAPCVNDTFSREVVVLSQAIERGLITGRGSFFDRRNNSEMTLWQASERGLVDPVVAKQLMIQTGLKDLSGKPMSVAQVTCNSVLDPDCACIVNPEDGAAVTPFEACIQGIMAPDKSVQLLLYICPVLIATNILMPAINHPSETINTPSVTIVDAIKNGLLDEYLSCFRDQSTGDLTHLEDAIQNRLLTLPWSQSSVSESVQHDAINARNLPAVDVLPNGDKSEHLLRNVVVAPVEFVVSNITDGMKKTLPVEPGSKKIESGFMTKVDSQFTFTTTLLAKSVQMTGDIVDSRHLDALQSIVAPRSNIKLSVEEAIHEGLLDSQISTFHNPVTDESIPVSLAIENGHILVSSGDVCDGVNVAKRTCVLPITGQLHSQTDSRLTVSDVIRDGILDQRSGLYKGTELNRLHVLPIKQPVEAGFIIADVANPPSAAPTYVRETKTFVLKSAIDPVANKTLSLAEALLSGVVDETLGVYVNHQTGESIPIHRAIEMGLIQADLVSVSAETDVDVNKISTTKLATLSITSVLDQRSGKIISVSRAIADGIIDPIHGLYYDLQSGRPMVLCDAIERHFVFADAAELLSDDPLERTEISSIHLTDNTEIFGVTLMEDVHTETMTLSIQSVIDPQTMQLISYDDAVERGIFRVKSGSYFNPLTCQSMSIRAAMEKGLVHGEVMPSSRKDDVMRSVLTAVNIDFPIDSITSVVDNATGKEISLMKAVQKGIVNQDSGSYIDSLTGQEMDLQQAFQKGLIHQSQYSDASQLEKSMEEEEAWETRVLTPRSPHDPENPWSKIEIEVEKTIAMVEQPPMSTDILHYCSDPETCNGGNKSLNAEFGKNLSYEEAVCLGIVNALTGEVRNPSTGIMMSLEKAITEQIICIDKRAISNPMTHQSFSLVECINQNLINPITGKLDQSRAEAQGFGIMKHYKQQLPMSALDAVASGLFHCSVSKFLEPQSGCMHTLQAALDNGIIDGSLVTVASFKPDERISLKHAVEKHLVDGKSAQVFCGNNNSWVPFLDAIQMGLVISVLDECCNIMDPLTGSSVPINQAISSGVIGPEQFAVCDTTTGEQVSMDVAFCRGIIDGNMAVSDKISGQEISPSCALESGLLSVVGAPIIALRSIVDRIKSCNSDWTDNVDGTCDQVHDGAMKKKSSNYPLSTNFLSDKADLPNPEISTKEYPFVPTTIYNDDVFVTAECNRQVVSVACSRNLIKSHMNTNEVVSAVDILSKSTISSLHPLHVFTASSNIAAVSRCSDGLTLNNGFCPVTVVAPTPTAQSTDDQHIKIDWQSGVITVLSTGQSMGVSDAVHLGFLNSETVEKLANSSRGSCHSAMLPVLERFKEKSEPNSMSHIVHPAVKSDITDRCKIMKIGMCTAEDVCDQNDKCYDTFLQNVVLPTSLPLDLDFNSLRHHAMDDNSTCSKRPAKDKFYIASSQSGVVPKVSETVLQGSISPISSVGRASSVRSIHNTPIAVYQITTVCKADDDILEIIKKELFLPAGSKQESMDILCAIQDRFLSPQTGVFDDPISGKKMSLSEAVQTGCLACASVRIVNTDTGKSSLLEQALTDGTMGEYGVIQDPRTHQLKTLKEALNDGSLVIADSSESSMSLDLSKTTQRLIVHGVVDSLTGRSFSLSNAVDCGVVDLNDGVYIDHRRDQTMNIECAVDVGLMSCQIITRTWLRERRDESGFIACVIFCEEKHSTVSSIIDPRSGCSLLLQDAIEEGIIDQSGQRYIDPISGHSIGLNSAIERQMLKTTPVGSDSVSLEADKKPTQINVVQTDYLNIKSVSNLPSLKVVSVSDAINLGMLNIDQAVFKNLNTGETFGFVDAFMMGCFKGDHEKYTQVNTSQSTHATGTVSVFDAVVEHNLPPIVSLDSATDEALALFSENFRPVSKEARKLPGIVPVHSAAMQKNMRVSNTSVEQPMLLHQVSSVHDSFPVTNADLSIGKPYEPDEGLQMRGFTLMSAVDTQVEQLVHMQDALRCGIIDPGNGTYTNKVKDVTMSLAEAVKQGLVILETGSTDPFLASIAKNTRSVSAVTDPTIGDDCPIVQSYRKDILGIEQGDSESVRTGQHMLLHKTVNVGHNISAGVEDCVSKDTVIVSTVSVTAVDRFSSGTTVADVDSVEHDGVDKCYSRKGNAASSSISEGKLKSKMLQLDMPQNPVSDEVTDSYLLSPDLSSPFVTRPADSYDRILQELCDERERAGSFGRALKAECHMADNVVAVTVQLMSLQRQRDDYLACQQHKLSVIYKADLLTENFQEELTPEQVKELISQSSLLKAIMDKVAKTMEKRLHHLTKAVENLTKVEEEMSKFRTWIVTDEQKLHIHNECLQRCEDLQALAEEHKALSSDVMLHQADLRFISLAVQKYIEEAKLHKLEVDSFCADRVRPTRHSLISMECVAADNVKDMLKDVTEEYRALCSRCSSFGDSLADLSGRQQLFSDAAMKLSDWLTLIESHLVNVKEEQRSAEPADLQVMLGRLRSLSAEALAMRELRDDMQHLGRDFTGSLNKAGVEEHRIKQVFCTMTAIADRYSTLKTDIGDLLTSIQMTTTQSQDVAQAIRNLVSWLDSTELAISGQTPVSLRRSVLNSQIRASSALREDITNRQSSLQAVHDSARKLLMAGGDLDIAKSVKQQLSVVERKFLHVQSRVNKRSSDLDYAHCSLNEFHQKSELASAWIRSCMQKANSKDFLRLPCDSILSQSKHLHADKLQLESYIVDLKCVGDRLTHDPRTVDIDAVQEAVAEMDRDFGAFCSQLDALHQKVDLMNRQAAAFDNCKTLTLLWLCQMEARLDEMEPVGIELGTVEQQGHDLQSIIKEYEDYSTKIDYANDIGNALDTTVSVGDRPMSPVRHSSRVSRLHGILSQRIANLSPTSHVPGNAQRHSPLSSDSSGVGSRKNSADNLLLDDLSLIQQELLDINQRYDIIGERLVDRHQELEQTLSAVETFSKDLQDFLHWIDATAQQADTWSRLSCPIKEEDANEQLKVHRALQREVLGKERQLDEIRRKAQKMMRSHERVLGVDSLLSLIQDLDDKWLGLEATYEHRRKRLDDILSDLHSFRENNDLLTRWLQQKGRMLDVLGPVAMEPTMLTSQLQQVKVLKDEIIAQEPIYDSYLACGRSILDRCSADCSEDKNAIESKLASTTKSWKHLQSRLDERRSSLSSVEGLTTEFDSLSRELGNWLSDFSDRLDSLGPSSCRQIDYGLEQLVSCESELLSQKAKLSRTQGVCGKLCERAKHTVAKSSLRSKLAALQKDVGDTSRKLAECRSNMEHTAMDMTTFQSGCRDMLTWVASVSERLDNTDSISGDFSTLHQQANQCRCLQKELELRECDLRKLVEKGEAFVREGRFSASVAVLTDTLGELQEEWARLERKFADRSDRLGVAESTAIRFHEQLDKILMWFAMTEERMHAVNVDDLIPHEAEKVQRDFQIIAEDVRKKEQKVKNLEVLGQALIDFVDCSKDKIDHHLKDIRNRWQDLNNAATDRHRLVEDMIQRMSSVNDVLVELNNALASWEGRLAAHNSLGSAAKDFEFSDEFQGILGEIRSLDTQYVLLEGMLSQLVSDGANMSESWEKRKKLAERHENLQERLTDLVTHMRTAAEAIDHFHTLLDIVGSNLGIIESRIDNLSPASRQQAELQLQKIDIQDLLQSLDNKLDNLNDLRQAGNFNQASYLSDPDVLKDQMQALVRQQSSLRSRVLRRQVELEVVSDQLYHLSDAVCGLRRTVKQALADLDSMLSVISDVESVKASQEELKRFVKTIVEPLRNNLDDVASQGQMVIKSTPAGSNISEVEEDVRCLSDLRAELIQSVADRENALSNALLRMGEFRDTLILMINWLSNTEEVMVNQKPPSPEQSIIKAQLQEQEMMQKALNDFSVNVSTLTESCHGLLQGLEGCKVKEEISDLAARCDALNACTCDRLVILASVQDAGNQFNDSLDSFSVWVLSVDSRFAALEPHTVYADSIGKLILQLQNLQVEVEQHDLAARHLAKTGKELQDLCKGEDAISVQIKIDDAQRCFGELRNRIDDSLEQMEEVLPLARQFQQAHAEFQAWIHSVEPELNAAIFNRFTSQNATDALVNQLMNVQSILKVINTCGAELSDIAPGDASLRVDDSINIANKRFSNVRERIEKLSEKSSMMRQRALEVTEKLDSILSWFSESEVKISNPLLVSVHASELQMQLSRQRAWMDELVTQQERARVVLLDGNKLGNVCDPGDERAFRSKLDQLKQQVAAVVGAANEQLTILEQSLPLACHFFETHDEMVKWFEDMSPQIAELDVSLIGAEYVQRNLEKAKALQQEVQDCKPVLRRLNKSGQALAVYCQAQCADQLNTVMEKVNCQMDDVCHCVRDRSISIDLALQQSAKFSDKLERMLDVLTVTAEQARNVEPVSAHPSKLREQIDETTTLEQDVEKRRAALSSVRAAAEELLGHAGDEQAEAAKEVGEKLAELTALFEEIEHLTHSRHAALSTTLGVAEKFWDDLHNLTVALECLQETLGASDKVALEPDVIREQQDELDAVRVDIEASDTDLEEVQQTGSKLIGLVGENEQVDVERNLVDAETTLATLNDQCVKRSHKLEAALVNSIHFQDSLMEMLVWLRVSEEKLVNMSPVGADFDSIRLQWEDLKIFKVAMYVKHLKLESVNQTGADLTKICDQSYQAAVVQDPINHLNVRWVDMMTTVVRRQRDIHLALLTVGQFDHAYQELMKLMDGTKIKLDIIKPIFGDAKLIEMEQAKLRIIENDIMAHQTSVDCLVEEYQRMILESSLEADGLKAKMEAMAVCRDKLQDLFHEKQRLLEISLEETQGFTDRLHDVLIKIDDLESHLITSKPVGGLPDSATDQLDKFMEVYNSLDNVDLEIKGLTSMADLLKTKMSGVAACDIGSNLAALLLQWDNVCTLAHDRKSKLEGAVDQARLFHGELNKFIIWLTETEKSLSGLSSVSCIVSHVVSQIEHHTILQKEISSQREVVMAVEKLGSRLRYFSQKQDAILIKNLLASVHHRWEKIVSRSAERTRHLERGYKKALLFNGNLKDLMTWLEEAEDKLQQETSVGSEPVNIKAHISKHKEFQRELGSKQPVYDCINADGRMMKEQCSGDDKPAILALLADLKSHWNSVCSKSVDRQRRLEEGLLLSGQIKDAIDGLLDWLARTEPLLVDDCPVCGDIDTVTTLMENHKTFQREFGARMSNVASVQKSAKEMISKAGGDSSSLQSDLIELTSAWDSVSRLSISKQSRLEQALKLAEQFHKGAQKVLDFLSETERQIRYKGAIPDEETVILQQLEDHKKFEDSLLQKETELRGTLNVGTEIMNHCHPDAVTIMKHWLSVLRARWEELACLGRQHFQRLNDGLSDVRSANCLLEDLLAWLNRAEVTLCEHNRQIIPDDKGSVEQLLREHQDFQNDMSSRQPDVDRLVRGDKQRLSSVSQENFSQIPVRAGTPRSYGRRHSVRVGGRSTPDASGRHIPECYGRVTPEYFGRLTPDHSTPGRRASEPKFRNVRVGALFNKWRNVWLVSIERHRRLQDTLDKLDEVERLKSFDFADWRKRYLRWMHHNKARIIDFFRRQDRDRDGRVTHKEFIDGIIASKFPTSQLEMEKVADIFDKDGDGFINYKEFVAALKPDRDSDPVIPEEVIQDEVRKQVCKCTCVKQFKIHKIGEGKYCFGDSQKLRLVRILRSTVMVRVGGGWVALDEFLVKNDPCRARGRTNMELRENFVLAGGVSQSLSRFMSKRPTSPVLTGTPACSTGSNRCVTSPTSGPFTKIRDRTGLLSPVWKQSVKTNPDGEVTEILSKDSPDGTKITRTKTTRDVLSPHDVSSPASAISSQGSSAGQGGRPASRPASDTGLDEPEVFTTVKTEKSNKGGRSETIVTYQTHVVKTHTVTLPTVTTTKISKIPKMLPTKSLK